MPRIFTERNYFTSWIDVMIRRITFCDVTWAVARYTLSFRPLFRDDQTGSGQAAHDTAHRPAHPTRPPRHYWPMFSPGLTQCSSPLTWAGLSFLPGTLIHCSSPHWNMSSVWLQCLLSFIYYDFHIAGAQSVCGEWSSTTWAPRKWDLLPPSLLMCPFSGFSSNWHLSIILTTTLRPLSHLPQLVPPVLHIQCNFWPEIIHVIHVHLCIIIW